MKTINDKLSKNLSENHIALKEILNNSSDLTIRLISINGQQASLIMCEGMVSQQTMSEFLVQQIKQYTYKNHNSQEMIDDILKTQVFATDQRKMFTYGNVLDMIMSGFCILLLDGTSEGICFGLQGFSIRSISTPTSEDNIKGSKEGFIEAIKINMTMVRRRMKSHTLKFEQLKAGKISNTDIILVYLTDKVSQDTLKIIKKRLKSVNVDVLLDSCYLQPFLEDTNNSIFSQVGYTERPDTLCAKIKEGRVGILVDGTPFSVVVPYFFNEHFQTLDDYSNRPFYASFIRILKYVGFLVSIFLPGLYVAISQYHLELLPKSFLSMVIEAQKNSVFPIMVEAIVIFFIYEILKEAGLRLPKEVGHTVSIIGALLIGEAAVNAGIIGAPMVMIVALTAITSFVVPSLYEQVTVLRIIIIVLGGTFGLFGFTIGLIFLIINITSPNAFNTEFSAPILPFKFKYMGDVIIRRGWKNLSKHDIVVEDFKNIDK